MSKSYESQIYDESGFSSGISASPLFSYNELSLKNQKIGKSLHDAAIKLLMGGHKEGYEEIKNVLVEFYPAWADLLDRAENQLHPKTKDKETSKTEYYKEYDAVGDEWLIYSTSKTPSIEELICATYKKDNADFLVTVLNFYEKHS